ncbi:hypothetical protein [Streptomyces sp. NRRL S-378]|uniref:hypothetical protein n=1 Tax=Streptomyces sp. NRRL S-378 TaxID=1463904 RepID=UPI0004C71D67|nr:hypothetical protein [Streptomyces sp. NRRL S-378]
MQAAYGPAGPLPAVEPAIGTDGRDALSEGGEACGGPVLDAATGAVLAVLGTALRAEHRSGGFAVALRAAAGSDPGEEEPSVLCRAVDRWAHDERPGRRVAAAAYGLATAPHVRTPADRELLRRAARALLARPADTTLHDSALAVLLRDPQVRARYLPDALASFAEPEPGSRLPAAALVATLPVLPDQDAVFAALRARADGERLCALAPLTTPTLARRAAALVREHLARSPGDARHAAAFVDRRLEQGPAAAPVLRPLVLDRLRTAPAGVRAELAAVLTPMRGTGPRHGSLRPAIGNQFKDQPGSGEERSQCSGGVAWRTSPRTGDAASSPSAPTTACTGGTS